MTTEGQQHETVTATTTQSNLHKLLSVQAHISHTRATCQMRGGKT